MMDILDDMSEMISSAMTPFNDYLIYDFRKEKIASIPDYMDKAFRQTVAFFGNQLKYIGYRFLTPEERLAYLFENTIRKGYVSIRKTETSCVEFQFEFQGDTYPIRIEVPFLRNNCVTYNDTEYYPLFPIVEKGGVNVTDNGTIIVKVMRIPITFGRRSTDKVQMESIAGNQYWDILVTVKIYQGATSKRGDRIPLILYHLCKLGFDRTMDLYKIPRGAITVTNVADEKDSKNEYFMLPNALFLKVRKDIMQNVFSKRVVLSLFKIYVENSLFSIEDVLGSNLEYYGTTLGKFIGSKSKDAPMNKLMLNNAIKHIEMTDLMLDGVAIEKLKSVDIHVNDIYELLHYMFFNIDRLMVSYNPIDLYSKMLGSLDQFMAGVIRSIAHEQYMIINSKKGAILEPATVKQFCKKASQRPTWISTTQVFRPEPAVYGDNWLLSVGLKRFLSLDSIETQYGSKKRRTQKTSPQLLKAHPSQVVVTSILDLPASNPVATGSLSTYLQIDREGNILRPDFAKEIDHVFD